MDFHIKKEFIQAANHQKLFTYICDDVERPIAVIQIFHGMGEHGERYLDFARFLNSQGFIVYISDLLGHGRTASNINSLGYIGEDGFNCIVNTTYKITQYIKTQHPNLPVIIFAHSFGSFVAQEYLSRYGSHIDAMILSGSALQKGFHILLGSLIASLQYHLFNEKKAAKLIAFLSFGFNNIQFKDSSSKARWLTSDKEAVKKYEEDPYCGTIFPINFYYYFFKGLQNIYKKNKLDKIRKDIPLLILSGSMDPVGGYGKSVKKLLKLYQTLGLKNVSLKLFINGRHELLNELDKQEVYLYLSDWIKQKLPSNN